MAVKIVFEDSILVSGIMCFSGCGFLIEDTIKTYLHSQFPNSEVIIDAEPQLLGIHKIQIKVVCKDDVLEEDASKYKEELRRQINSESQFTIIPEVEEKEVIAVTNWLNILINIVTIITIIILVVIFPPSLFLTIGLTILSFVVAAFTAREYLLNVIKTMRFNNIFNMNTTVTLALALSLSHTIYHLSFMPLVKSFAMAFMDFGMPLILVTIINVMDEIKAFILRKAKMVTLSGLRSLFPEMADEYDVYETLDFSQEPLAKARGALVKGDLIKVNQGQAFPVDGIIRQGSTFVDTSLINGELAVNKGVGDEVFSGYVNLGSPVYIEALSNSYNSKLNKTLFETNVAIDANKDNKARSGRWFYYLYFGMILLGFSISVVLSLSFGVFTVSMMLQIMTGVLFAICPCTIAISHLLPQLLGVFSLNKQGILIPRYEQMSKNLNKIDIVVLDKTGTLTTSDSEVVNADFLRDDILINIASLESSYGSNHPIARAILAHCRDKFPNNSFAENITDVSLSFNGISAQVAGKNLVIGNAAYLQRLKLIVPRVENSTGLTVVYVYENDIYQGSFLIKHVARPDIITSLKKLKQQGKKIILLTGDTLDSAQGFNQQNDLLFDKECIYAGKSPEQKSDFLKDLIKQEGVVAQNIWFVGDGLNDARVSREVSKQGGISCAITPREKTAFYTDITLNGSLGYLLEYECIQDKINTIILQNKFILLLGAIIFLSFLISFPLLGIGISPLIPMLVMLLTTFFVVFNSYRVQVFVANSLKKETTFLERYISSDLSIILLIGASIFLTIALLVASISSLSFTLPMFVFSAGLISTISSSCLLLACAMFGGFAFLSAAHLLHKGSMQDDSISEDYDLQKTLSLT